MGRIQVVALPSQGGGASTQSRRKPGRPGQQPIRTLIVLVAQRQVQRHIDYSICRRIASLGQHIEARLHRRPIALIKSAARCP
jgi:hypothetical protein